MSEQELSTIQWTDIEPVSPYHLFMPFDRELKSEYEMGWPVPKVMQINTLGFQTHRNYFAIDFDETVMFKRIQEMRDSQLSDEDFYRKYGVKDNRDWQLGIARLRLREKEDWQKPLIKCQFQPFDIRYCYFDEIAMDYPRRVLLDHVANQENLCVNIVRQTKMTMWRHAVVSDKPTPAVYVEMKDGSSMFPLYLYPDDDKTKMFDDLPGEWEGGKDGRVPNLNPAFIEEMEGKLGLSFVSEGSNGADETEFTPEDVFYYAYAVFHSPTYRSRYAEFLKIDFPRLPLMGDVGLFRALCVQGAALVDLHLLKGIARADFITMYPERGDDRVLKSKHPRYEAKDRRVYINKTQYFQFKDNIDGETAEMIWNFRVGGYQVGEKWLKDRRERVLSSDEIRHYQKVLVALWRTDAIMSAIDEMIPAFPL